MGFGKKHWAWDWDWDWKGSGMAVTDWAEFGSCGRTDMGSGMTWDGNGQRIGLWDGWVFGWHDLEMFLCFGMELVLGVFGGFMSGVLWAVWHGH